MKVRNTFYLFLTLIVLASVYFVLEIVRPNIISQKLRDKRQLLNLKIGDEINLLEIKKNGEAVRLENMSGVWRIIYPFDLRADQVIANGLSLALKVSEKEEFTDIEKDYELKDYGLEEPALEIGIGTAERPKRRFFLIGDKVPLSSRHYAKWDDSEEVFMLGGLLVKSLDKNIYALRDKMIFDYKPDEMSAVEIVLGEAKLFLIRKGGEWLIKKEVEEEIVSEPAKVQSLLEDISFLHISDFFDPEDWRKDKFGLKNMRHFIAVKSKSGTERRLFVGYLTKDKEAYLCKIDGEAGVVLVNRNSIEAMKEHIEVLS